MRQLLYTIIISLVAMGSYTTAQAEIYSLDEARELYKAGQYEKAAPTFKAELKKKPKHGSYNHWYGVCLYHMRQYEDAIKYLKQGVERKVTLSNYYLAEVYMALYRFEEAIDAYNAYLTFIKKDKKNPIEDIDKRIAMAKMGQKMMRGVECVQVIDSIAIDSLDFIKHYRLSPEAGRLVDFNSLPEALQANSNAIAYIPQRADAIYMGHRIDDNYDLCVSNNLVGSDWSPLHSISDNINTDDNQNYPYLLSDGPTLYFAQDGSNSLGGYDLFITMFNSERGDYMLPQNLGMPFNSFDNDFMMAIDEHTGAGWFITDRNHIPGMLTLYIFIPNESKEVYSSDNEKLPALAKLSSIADTWVEDADYSTLLEKIASISPNMSKLTRQEFYFVLCDGLVYTQMSNFKNSEARQYYEQARALQQKIDNRKAQLNALRQQYARANSSEKAQLSNTILNLEQEILNNNESPLIYENRARRAELNFLDINIE
ncbi:MAG: CDC27 family protein [Bacteroidaceae bacterium]|nr:CDC27 family protein [Bacteroidaceae bacterium]